MNERAGGRAADASRGRSEGNRKGAGLLRLLGALVVVNALLLLPDFVLLGGRGAAWIAVEACLIASVFALLPRRRSTWIAAIGVGALAVLVFLVEVGETTTWLALHRPLNLSMDVWLLDSVHHLLVGMLGMPTTLLAELIALAVLVGTGAVVAWLLASGPSRLERSGPRAPVLAAAAVVAAGGVALDLIERPDVRVDKPVVRLVRDQSSRWAQTRADRAAFAADLATAPSSYADTPGLLSRLGGSDVVLAFVESYGLSAIEDPRYAPIVGPRLDDLAARAEAAGLHLVSGRFVAPSQGGQSWFGHASMLSGLWLDSQIRYDALLRSGRETLVDDFRHAGYRTVALMPAITMAWPEGVRFGYDEVWARDDIDYAGPPLNWVTMPDQFTWSFLQETIRPREPARPLFAELGLVSSHAPWTPILPVLDDWDEIGDGAVFDRWRDAGEAPEELWLDRDRVREHYARSVEYAVHVAASWAERYLDDGTLLILLGDHQPAPLVTGDDATWEVPVHVLSGDRALVEPFLEWGFAEGARPDGSGEALGMDFFRAWFVEAYSGDA